MSKLNKISNITQGEDILSALDVFDLDESFIDEKLKSLIEKTNIKTKHLKTILVFVKYKYIITLQEETDCDNKELVDFSINHLLKAVCADDDFQILLDIFSISLALSTETILNYVEHILQQLLTAIDYTPTSLQDSSKIIVYLKVLDCLLDVCTQHAIVIDSRFLNEEIDKLLLKREPTINTQLFSKTIPKIVYCCEDFDILNVVWNRIATRLDSLDIQDFVMLCAMSDFYFPSKEDKLFSIMDFGIIKNKEFWILISNGFLSEDYSSRKCSIYLARRALVFAADKNTKLTVALEGEDLPQFQWDPQNKAAIESAWMNLFVLLESLEEKQAHLVLSAMHLLGELKVIQYNWYNCAIIRAMSHETDAVILKAIEMALKNDNPNHTATSFPFNQLLKVLNNTFLYENAHNEDQNQLLPLIKTFLSHEKNLANMMECLGSISLSPIPKFYMSFALISMTKTKPKLYLNTIVQSFIGDNTSTSNNVFLRFATQCCLFLFIKDHLPCLPNMTDFNLFFSSTMNSLRRGSKQWKDVAFWVNNFKNNEQTSCNIKSMMNISYLKNFSDIKPLVRMFILCVDAQIIEQYEFLEFTKVLIQLLSDAESREYASDSEFDLIFFFIIYSVKEILPSSESYNENERDELTDNLIDIVNSKVVVILNYLQKRLRSVSELSQYEVINKYAKGLSTLFQAKNISQNLYVAINSLFDVAQTSLVKGNVMQKYFSVQIIALKAYGSTENLDTADKKKISQMCFKLINAKGCTLEFNSENIDYEMKTLRGKMVSSFNRAICDIYICFYKILEDFKPLDLKELEDKVMQLLESGGFGCLPSTILLSQILLPKLVMNNSIDKAEKVIERIWKEIFEVRKNEQFKKCVVEFIAMLFQREFIASEKMVPILIHYGDKIFLFGEQSPYIVCELMKHLKLVSKDIPLQSIATLISKALTFGCVLRKDQRIEFETCNFILSHKDIFQCESIEYISNPIKNTRLTTLDILKEQNEDFNEKLSSELKLRLETISGSKPRYHGNSLLHRVLLRVLQALLLSHKVHPNAKVMESNVQWCIQNLIKQPHHVSTRIMLEWYIALFIVKSNLSLNHHVAEELHLTQIPELSYFMIIYHVVKHQISASRNILLLKDNKSNAYYENLKTSTLELDNYVMCQNFHFAIETFLPYTMGQLFNLRLHAQFLTLKLFQLAEHTRYREKYNIICDTIVKTFQASADEKNLKKIQDNFYVNVFDVVCHLTVDSIYHHVPRLSGVAKDELIIQDNMNIKQESTPVVANLEEIIIQQNQLEDNDKQDVVLESTSFNFQKKFVPWKNLLADLNIIQDKISEDNCDGSGLIVVASLIDRLPNLGGLSRTCEVFGVKQYVIDSLKHIQDKQFQTLSVSSERWIDIDEVRPGNDLKKYLLQMKDQGYSIVGAEQTSSSICLNEFKFPKHTILLLGHEKEGIACDLLSLVDYCVEIPQCGVVRSLNVHVTASIFIWEYNRQYPVTNKA